MKKEYTSDELLHKVAAYCSMTERSVSEVKDKLSNWGASETDSKKIISYLIKEGFIDEQRYTKAFVTDKFRFNKWGKIKISLALKAKGVSGSLIQDAVNSIDEEEYENTLNSLLKAKLKSIKYTSDYERDGKLFRFAQSRGFESKVIERVVRDLTPNS